MKNDGKNNVLPFGRNKCRDKIIGKKDKRKSIGRHQQRMKNIRNDFWDADFQSTVTNNELKRIY